VWPPGVFLAPGVHGVARPEARARLQAALQSSAAGPDDKHALGSADDQARNGRMPHTSTLPAPHNRIEEAPPGRGSTTGSKKHHRVEENITRLPHNRLSDLMN
jgi:hypothetical protein